MWLQTIITIYHLQSFYKSGVRSDLAGLWLSQAVSWVLVSKFSTGVVATLPGCSSQSKSAPGRRCPRRDPASDITRQNFLHITLVRSESQTLTHTSGEKIWPHRLQGGASKNLLTCISTTTRYFQFSAVKARLQGMFCVRTTCAFLCRLPLMASCPAWDPHHALQVGTAERNGARQAALEPSGFTLELGPHSPESHGRGVAPTLTGKGRDGHWEDVKGHCSHQEGSTG